MHSVRAEEGEWNMYKNVEWNIFLKWRFSLCENFNTRTKGYINNDSHCLGYF